ncbi:hypothetical protein M427DRAFT_52878, partial [Gonapodya prolifera JEL478]
MSFPSMYHIQAIPHDINPSQSQCRSSRFPRRVQSPDAFFTSHNTRSRTTNAQPWGHFSKQDDALRPTLKISRPRATSIPPRSRSPRQRQSPVPFGPHPALPQFAYQIVPVLPPLNYNPGETTFSGGRRGSPPLRAHPRSGSPSYESPEVLLSPAARLLLITSMAESILDSVVGSIARDAAAEAERELRAKLSPPFTSIYHSLLSEVLPSLVASLIDSTISDECCALQIRHRSAFLASYMVDQACREVCEVVARQAWKDEFTENVWSGMLEETVVDIVEEISGELLEQHGSTPILPRQPHPVVASFLHALSSRIVAELAFDQLVSWVVDTEANLQAAHMWNRVLAGVTLDALLDVGGWED